MTAVLPQFEHATFDSEATRVMGEAFDRACLALNGRLLPRVVQEAIANRTIEEAHAGERDLDRLCWHIGRLSWQPRLLRRHQRSLPRYEPRTAMFGASAYQRNPCLLRSVVASQANKMRAPRWGFLSSS